MFFCTPVHFSIQTLFYVSWALTRLSSISGFRSQQETGCRSWGLCFSQEPSLLQGGWLEQYKITNSSQACFRSRGIVCYQKCLSSFIWSMRSLSNTLSRFWLCRVIQMRTMMALSLLGILHILETAHRDKMMGMLVLHQLQKDHIILLDLHRLTPLIQNGICFLRDTDYMIFCSS